MGNENEVAREVVDSAYKVHVALGPGLLESAYEAALTYELEQRGLRVERQVPVRIRYEGLEIEVGYRADMPVGECVLIELKSVEKIIPVHKKQLLTYLKTGDFRLGLPINFGGARVKDGITRIVNALDGS